MLPGYYRIKYGYKKISTSGQDIPVEGKNPVEKKI
jgi:hypothetical protein